MKFVFRLAFFITGITYCSSTIVLRRDALNDICTSRIAFFITGITYMDNRVWFTALDEVVTLKSRFLD